MKREEIERFSTKREREDERMRYAVSVGFLGYTRCNNVCAYNPESRGFDDLTPAEARRFIDSKQLKGVLWRNGEDGPEFYPDEKGFNQKDIMIKSANKFRPMQHDVLAGNPINSIFSVVRVLDTDYKGRLFEIVSNKYSRVKVTEDVLRELNNISNVAGVFITEDNIEVCDGVQYENRKEDAEFKKGIYKDGIAVESLPSLQEVKESAKQFIKQEQKKEEEQQVTESEEQQTEPVETESDQSEPNSLDEVFGGNSDESWKEEENGNETEQVEQPEENKEQSEPEKASEKKGNSKSRSKKKS